LNQFFRTVIVVTSNCQPEVPFVGTNDLSDSDADGVVTLVVPEQSVEKVAHYGEQLLAAATFAPETDQAVVTDVDHRPTKKKWRRSRYGCCLECRSRRASFQIFASFNKALLIAMQHSTMIELDL
jgi:hypothetical protein